MSKSKSNATAERPDVIPIATFQCFPGSDLTLMVMLLSNCAYYLYLEPWPSGLKCTKLQTAAALNAEPVVETGSESPGCGVLTVMAVKKARTYITCKQVGILLQGSHAWCTQCLHIQHGESNSLLFFCEEKKLTSLSCFPQIKKYITPKLRATFVESQR